MPYAYKVQALGIIVPAIIIYARLECFGNIGFLFACQVHYAKAVAVTFVSVAFHALPSDVLAVGREFGVDVVTFVLIGVTLLFAQVGGAFAIYIIKVDVRVGRNGISQALFLAAGVCYLFGIATPCQLLNAAERFHGGFKRLAFHNVGSRTHHLSVKVGKERVRSCFHPFVPMFVHQVVYDDAACFGQVGVEVYGALSVFYLRDEKDFLAVG